MTRLTKRKIASFSQFTDVQLQTWWQEIGLNRANYVKSGRNKGQIKLSACRRGDAILAELRRRADGN